MSKPNIERRRLIQGVALAGATANIPLAVGATVKPMLDQIQRVEFPLPDFASHVAESVAITGRSGERLMGMIESVDSMDYECEHHRRPGYLRDSSTVVRFKISNAHNLLSDLYSVKHSALGEIKLLLTVVPNRNGDLGLEAVFN